MLLFLDTDVIYSLYVMDELNEGRTKFFSDDKAKRIEFNISLVKISEDLWKWTLDI